MKVQIVRRPILVLSGFLLSTLLVGCFGGGIDPKDDPVQPGGGNNAANAEEEPAENNAGLNENAAGEEGGNNIGANAGANNNNNLNQGGDNGGKDGEAINNAADDDFLNGNNANANIGAAANGQANMFGNNPIGGLNNNNNPNNNNNLNKNNNNNLGNNNFGLNTGDNEGDGALVNGAGGDILESPDLDKGAIDNTITNTAEESTLAPVAGSPSAPAPAVGTPGNGVVRYVTSGGSKLYDKPNGETLRSLEQGDHPLVNEEGEWSRTSDGYYVPAASLTAAPVPRLKQPKEWR